MVSVNFINLFGEKTQVFTQVNVILPSESKYVINNRKFLCRSRIQIDVLHLVNFKACFLEMNLLKEIVGSFLLASYRLGELPFIPSVIRHYLK